MTKVTGWMKTALNKSMKANLRCKFALPPEQEFGRDAYVPSQLSAAVAYFYR